jgi:hypothetical protein
MSRSMGRNAQSWFFALGQQQGLRILDGLQSMMSIKGLIHIL